MQIALYHAHYDEKHLAEVAAEMETIGAPAIRAIWSECYGMWLAVEGCHRLRAAQTLGLTPTIIDISNDETTTVQDDGDDVEVNVLDLAIELTDAAWQAEILRF